MTDAEWLASGDLEAMLKFLKGKTSERKLRLFAVACARNLTDLVPFIERPIRLAERFADGVADDAQRDTGLRDGPSSHTAGLVTVWLLGEKMIKNSIFMAGRFGSPLLEEANEYI